MTTTVAKFLMAEILRFPELYVILESSITKIIMNNKKPGNEFPSWTLAGQVCPLFPGLYN